MVFFIFMNVRWRSRCICWPLLQYHSLFSLLALLVAYQKDPAGHNIAKFISQELEKNGNVYKGKDFDLSIISSPVISADLLEEKFDYDGYIFLSKHAAESGVLALTCHNTGNFSDANFGGYNRQILPLCDMVLLQEMDFFSWSSQ